ncbi:hypothetical protein V6N12_033650 [Hibiscus sabdariffa]|uniref:RIN4 pathogenic type III effector avirulence factor Avr cleavage site domain-containing protein n=1 Tax=Hibiscus sabdariffa TaxID=183260 RepID=A0ABR2BWF1_9ROSI
MAQQRGKPLPKFGEWDVNNPATAEGFTVIFNNARDEKKTRGKAVNAMSSASSKKTDIPPSPPTPKKELGVTWDVDLYEKLLKIAGGKERLVDQALDKGVKVAVCSTSNEKAAIYTLAANTLNVEPSSVVVEDGAIGLAAAKAAGMTCIVTKSGYTADEDFLNADAVFDCIGDPPEEKFDLAFCASLLERQYVS